MEKKQFFEYLHNEFIHYQQIPSHQIQEKKEKKEYINGLMKASRFWGVSFEELQDVISSKKMDINPSEMHYVDNVKPLRYLDIPAFIRNRYKLS